ncbi:heavy metal translocating P-type ATPase [Paenibacillus dokdonensis]|uniref:heavy metal translocating P-type ATPase n=1 Tax=Paenibacillus dokdonensis TaxID=2567944 RepID=UPI001FEB5638|nr:heavy metal translocating P-type ATPase [Paenibacillus dokdonensis]
MYGGNIPKTSSCCSSANQSTTTKDQPVTSNDCLKPINTEKDCCSKGHTENPCCSTHYVIKNDRCSSDGSTEASCCGINVSSDEDKGCCSDNSNSSQTIQEHQPFNTEGMQELNYLIQGMDCPACAVTIERSIQKLNGIQSVRVNYSTSKMLIEVKNVDLSDQIVRKVQKLGYSIESTTPNDMELFTIEGMDCAACAKSIEKHLQKLPDVRQVNVNFSTGKMKIAHQTNVQMIIREIGKAGYKAIPVSQMDQPSKKNPFMDGTFLTILSGITLILGFLLSIGNVPQVISTALYAASIIVGGYRPVKSAFYAVKGKSLDMNVLMSAAAIGAALIGQWFEGATVVFLFALGSSLQNISIERTRDSIRGLVDLAPSEAWIKENGGWIKKPVQEVSVGSIMLINPGEKIPLDGDVLSGHSSVNQAPITGESLPVDKESGDPVYAGTINQYGSLEVKATKIVRDTAIARIIHLVEEAQEKKSPTQALVDRFAQVYTPVIFTLAVLIIVIPSLFGWGTWTDWIYKGLELLVVACPCALVISTPVAIVSAIGNAARNGILIKGGAFLEVAGALQVIAFDKTGTLTQGNPKVTNILAAGVEESEILSIALTIEEQSTHPIAKAITDFAKGKNIQSLSGYDFKAIPGQGAQAKIQGKNYYAGNIKLFRNIGVDVRRISADVEKLQEQGNSTVIMGTDETILGIITVADAIRNTTVDVLQKLKAVGIEKSVMLTGDNIGTAQRVASSAGIDDYMAELMPEEKVNAIKHLQIGGKVVGMVGDGINDAPALATANLGIAMGGAGTDAAIETADIVLMADNLEKLPHTIKLSRKALRIIKQNIWFSLIVKIIALFFIFPGWLTLWIAVLSDTGAALIVILNSLRLLKTRN